MYLIKLKSAVDILPNLQLGQLVDVSNQISQACTPGNPQAENSFTVTGRGGLPLSPDEPLSNDVVWTDTRLPATTVQQYRSKKPAAKPPSKSETVAIVPATGWVFNGKGEVTLISSVSNATIGSTPATCSRQ